ncbi:hypothetical protein [Pseudonocardia phyllosphaerae]|uniref:hypothetical protein n=1 Tax=Pseudonocardia phyllosphaerae TaxID=3390502 RepID=UPI00397AFB14
MPPEDRRAEPSPDTVELVAARLKERIYAGLTVMAVLAGHALSHAPSHRATALTVIGTSLGLWLATVAAEQQAHRVVHGSSSRSEVLRQFYVTSPLLTAAIAPLVLITLSALGAFPLEGALWAAVGIDAASLFGFGVLSGLRMRARWSFALVSGLVNLGIGAFVVAVKVWAGH